MKGTASLIVVGLAATVALEASGDTNNNAVLVCGTTVEHGQSPKSPFWDGGGEMESGRNEFWNDIFLMWETLYANQRCSLYVPEGTPQADKRSYDHIWVLYGDGVDYRSLNPRYQPSTRYGIDPLTDWSGSIDGVDATLTYLAGEMTDDDLLFCYLGNHGATGEYLSVLDVSNPMQPSEIGHYYYYYQELKPTVQNVFVFEDRAYLARGEEGIDIIDISSPSSPEWLGGEDTQKAYNVQVSRHVATGELYAYVADNSHMKVINVTDPESPQTVCRYWPVQDRVVDVFVFGDYAYLACSVSAHVAHIG